MISRIKLAEHLCSGLAGWHQLQVAQNLGTLSGEDSARNIIAQIVNSQGRFAPATSQLPKNWGATKRRIDIALLGRTQNATTWYGSVEVKWPGTAFDPHLVREQIVQDALRVTFVETSVLNANFVLLGGAVESIRILFDDAHPNAADRESRRLAFGSLFSRNLTTPDGFLNNSRWSKEFPEACDRVPKNVLGNFNGKIKTKLLALSESRFSSAGVVGSVFLWQCNRTRGAAAA
ncbi:hypothetical protein [Tahibacter harae]|uniref:Uncharacterized protein n=1 Tax=Tahibacter harae TaxID=2963937 RepID=A0ABT1QYN0_9GAMM|nr:hypothetical protein [Tahibacter harae]MCQ4167400.1 hypothetical protein [Tahibacter harae]